MSKNMKHYIVVSLDINYKNIVIIGFGTERKADNAIEKIQLLGRNKYGCTWYDIDFYGYCDADDVFNYYRNNNIVYFKQRKSYFSKKAIEHILQKLEN